MNYEVLEVVGYECPEERYIATPMTNKFIAFLNKQVPAVLASYFLNNESVYICGGFMRAFFAKEDVNDVDFYFKDTVAYEDFKKFVASEGYAPLSITGRAVTYKKNDCKVIQAICYITGDIKEVLGAFDYTIVKCGATRDTIYKHYMFDGDLKEKILSFTGSQLPLSSLHRAFKYAKRGYSMRANEMIAISMAINDAIDFNSADSVIQGIESFDPALANDLIS